jgi:acetoin utilization deacetylase AcuC-like enzyme
VTVLLLTHERYLDHDLGRGHPERPDRLRSVLAGIEAAGLSDGIERVVPRPATRQELERVHAGVLVSLIERIGAEGGGWLDADTAMNDASYDAALLAAGAGLSAIEALEAGTADSAFCAVRPPGHHATPTRSMGFCLFNNVAVAAAALADRGERVLVVDYDAHHGNGTQDIFWSDDRVAYASFHQYPLYPGSGGLREVGAVAATFAPTWLLISAGFDAHRADPITDLGLSAGDFADLTAALLVLAPPGRRLVFLEGGYDLDALAGSAAACVAAMLGERHVPEATTAGGPGREVVAAATLVRAELSDFG